MKKACLQLAAMVAVTVLLLSTQVPNGECFSNATRSIADSLVDTEAEFLMESETARRILQQQPKNSYQVIKDRKGYCIDGDGRYGCDPRVNKNGKLRNCGLSNHCDRSAVNH